MQKAAGLILSLLIVTLSLLLPSAASQPETALLPAPDPDAVAGIPSDIRESAEYKALSEAGFPASYAEPLAALLIMHPDWEFVPLGVTELCDAYTWDAVLTEELSIKGNNLIADCRQYAPCFHPTDTALYDSGYRAVSREALAYFMDPRNFLNETDIFQFFDVSAGTDTTAVQAVLDNTFMAGDIPGGTETYASLLERIGRQYSVNAVYLAVRGKLEHGTRGTPTAFGNCGDIISKYSGKDESSLNGYYNFFNMGAAGNGTEEILRTAVRRAITGTDGVVWDTLEKSVAGGTAIIADRFVTNYQSTPYLLKFNVDVRSTSANGISRNFWGQHAQNVQAAFSEGQMLAKALASSGCTDGHYRFSIPVYEGMPETPSPIPQYK